MSVKDADGHKLNFYPRETSRVLDGDLDHSLLQVEIGPTNACNNRCSYCSLDWVSRDRTDIGTGALLSALEDMADIGVRAVYFAGEGEPLLHKDFPQFIEKAAEVGMKTSLSTNGTLLTEDISKRILPHLSWIRIGIDASTPETYSKIHGVPEHNFGRVIENIGYAAKVKRENGYHVDIGIQALALPSNIGEIEGLTKIVKDAGVDNIQIKPFSNHPEGSDRELFVNPHTAEMEALQHTLQKYDSEDFTVVYRAKTMDRILTERPYKECDGLHFWTLLDAKGNVLPCNLFYDKEGFSYGNINENSFKDIWQGEKRREVMDKVAELDKCKTCGDYKCRPDLFNRHMYRLKNPEPNDDFI
jgi:GTP 3',8-cyclase